MLTAILAYLAAIYPVAICQENRELGLHTLPMKNIIRWRGNSFHICGFTGAGDISTVSIKDFYWRISRRGNKKQNCPRRYFTGPGFRLFFLLGIAYAAVRRVFSSYIQQSW